MPRALLYSNVDGIPVTLRRFASQSAARHVVVVQDARSVKGCVEDSAAAREAQREALRALYSGATLSFVILASIPLRSLRRILADADLVHIEGGQTFALTRALSRRPAVRAALRDTIRRVGGVGQSAGAILLGAYRSAQLSQIIKGALGDVPHWEGYILEHNLSEQPLDRKTTLGIAKCAIFVHYDNDPLFVSLVRAYATTHLRGRSGCIYCIKNKGHLIVDASTGRVLEANGVIKWTRRGEVTL